MIESGQGFYPRQVQIDVCAAITQQLGGNADPSPSTRAARAVLAVAARRLVPPAIG